MMFHKLATRNQFMNSEEDEISEKDIPENEDGDDSADK